MNYNDYMNSLEPNEELMEKTGAVVETAITEHNKTAVRRRKTILISALCVAVLAVSAVSARAIIKNKKPVVEPGSSTVSQTVSKEPEESTTDDSTTETTTEKTVLLPRYNSAFGYELKKNQLCDFDIAFLKAENTMQNKVYSPLSIKYALRMLEDGAGGESRAQISKVLGDYSVTRYASSENMSLANALFVRDSFKMGVKDSFITALKTRYGAEVIFDPFEKPDNLNNWVKDNTLNLIPKMFDDVSENNFILVNALGIDMEWETRFFDENKREKGLGWISVSYEHERYAWSVSKDGFEGDDIKRSAFDNEKQEVAGMEIFASMDNYDIVKILGEDNVRNTVETAYRKFIKENGTDSWGHPLTDSKAIEKEVSSYMEKYMEEIKRNYTLKGEIASIDFSLYADDDVKVFAKDLKQYNGTALQYISIMPVKDDLDKFIDETDAETLNKYIGSLKDLKRENFKDGVITRIHGFVPKFKFDYSLNLKDDLSRLGITDVFDSKKADLSRLTDEEGVYISKAEHKSNIELTQDGIKAAASTMSGGAGAGGPDFDYIYDVPIEDIDLTFDKPYMFIIRDKNTGDVWFTGTVYKPLQWEEEPEVIELNERAKELEAKKQQELHKNKP